MRRVAKSINFGLSYGMSSYGLAQRTDLSQEDADRFVQSYFDSYPGVKVYMDRTRQQAARQGYVETLLGRRSYLPQFQSSRQVHASERGRAEREAINHPIQGTAADIMKLAMIRLHDGLEARRLGARMLLQVHDELVLEVPEAEIEATVPVVCEAMEGAFDLDAPLKADVKIGPNWEEMTVVK
jgi:DNA polymerase-1